MSDPVTAMILIDVAMMGASMALSASQKIKGPRLDDTNVTLADYGTPIPRFWGIRRFEAQIIWAEKLTEKKHTSKTKGGKYSDYRYFGTWAVVIADHQIDSVSRVWLDKHLAYDVTGAGPISIGAIIGDDGSVKLATGSNFRVYLGDQVDPDPRIEAWCEDRYGANTCPAYKDVSYIVFQDIPLEKFGNRIPQISIEAINNKTDSFPYEIVGNAGSGIDGVFSPDGLIMYQEDGTSLFVWDVPSRTIINTRTNVTAASPTAGPDALYTATGAIFSHSGEVWQFGADGSGGTLLTPNGYDSPMGGCRCVAGQLYFYPITTNESNYGLYSSATVTAVSLGYATTHFFEGPDQSAWSVGVDSVTEDNLNIQKISDATASGAHITTAGGLAYGMYNGDGGIVIWQDNKLYLLDATDPSIILAGPTALSVSTPYVVPAFNAVHPGAPKIWIGFSEVDTRTLTVLRTLDPVDWVSQGSLTSGCYDPINHAFLTHEFGTDEVTFRYIDRVGSNGVTLQTVVDDVADWCGLTGQDTTALTQTVPGYSVTQGSGKDMLAPLLDIHDVDPRPHDFAIQFVNRGAVAAGTISTSELAREGEENRYVASIAQDTDLPRKITFNFADKDHDQQSNNVIAQRPLDAVDAQREQSIDLGTYVADPATAQKFADRYLRRQWIGRDKFSLSLTAQRLALEPADVYNLELDGITTTARLTKVTLAGGKLNTEWERDFPAITVLGTGSGSSMGGRDPETIYIPGPTKGLVIDTPLLSDADSNTNPLLYYAAGPYTSTQNWPGAFFMQGDPDGLTFDIEWNAILSSNAARWGYSTDALDDVASSWLWDRGNTVNVKGYGTLTSCTEADINADPTLNLAYLGGELLNFTTATLEADGSYTLSGFKRGRRGTEWATSTHVVNDEFVLASALLNEGMGLSDVGVNLHFKAQTSGRPVESAAAIDVNFAGRSLMPYAPARLKQVYDGTDIQCEIIRRTRVGGSWVGGATIPLSENSEEYEVEVYNGATLKRTITVTATNTFAYTAAMATADGITLPTPPSFLVYQMSDAVGRGFALAA